MKWLVDTNILLSSAQTSHPAYGNVARVVRVLLTREDELFVIAQNVIEFWAVATRPIANNGFGLTTAQATQELTKLKALLAILPDTAERYLSTPLFADIGADMNEEELTISRSTPSGQLVKAA